VGFEQWVVHNTGLGPCSDTGGFSPDELSKAAKEKYGTGRLSEAGRALQKHLDPVRSDAGKWTLWAPVTRNPTGYNEMGEAFVDDLITNPNTIWKSGGAYINAWESTDTGARGAEWIINERRLIFSGFL